VDLFHWVRQSNYLPGPVPHDAIPGASSGEPADMVPSASEWLQAHKNIPASC
jgi:hypothetical protein